MRDRLPNRKAGILALSGIVGLAAGYGLHPVTPIIKRIATSSFVIAGGGWCLLALAFAYWLIDVRGIKAWSKFLAVVGMNCIAIYLFTESGGTAWVVKLVRPFTMGFLAWAGELAGRLATSATAWAILWGMCWWLYKKKIFIRI